MQIQCLSCCEHAGWLWPSHTKDDGLSFSPVSLKTISFILIYCAEDVLCLVHGHMCLIFEEQVFNWFLETEFFSDFYEPLPRKL